MIGERFNERAEPPAALGWLQAIMKASETLARIERVERLCPAGTGFGGRAGGDLLQWRMLSYGSAWKGFGRRR